MRARDAAWDGGWAGVQDGAHHAWCWCFPTPARTFYVDLAHHHICRACGEFDSRNRFIEYCFCESAVLKSKVADTDFDKNVNLLPRYRALRMRRLDRARVHHHLGRCF